ncbi:Kunitz/Bovine pancreatic trypsin inhibitor domain protein [Teladorsagia circumcincta]|uniref:Kunitz/Bovine pancreatic trypsin inhibitor domain protein n=1 Tax=Teladorsagia circumcincta TaxID=45464 RepID=A0A2G9V567_TELCI|nr:Kunitz/Bovine pancreatic trypsin inhibitor domain protein [Teladorsagia circumcincta]
MRACFAERPCLRICRVSSIFVRCTGTNPCAEPWTKGEGEASLTRFYYDSIKRKCLAFNYLGLKGNQNNFLTKELCEVGAFGRTYWDYNYSKSNFKAKNCLLMTYLLQATCPVWVNPCAVGQPILTPDQHPFRCHQSAPCSTGYYCHIGFDETTTVCCQSQGDPCSLVVKEGYGSQSMNRWFYNHQTRQCQPFTYRGVGGNENNFLLREHCEVTCPVWVNACPKGEALLLPTGRPQHCNPAMDDSCPQTHWCHPGPDKTTTMCCPGRADPCMSAMSEGEGPLRLTRYYFDASKRQCLEFNFRGIRGNAVRFTQVEDYTVRPNIEAQKISHPLTIRINKA